MGQRLTGRGGDERCVRQRFDAVVLWGNVTALEKRLGTVEEDLRRVDAVLVNEAAVLASGVVRHSVYRRG